MDFLRYAAICAARRMPAPVALWDFCMSPATLRVKFIMARCGMGNRLSTIAGLGALALIGCASGTTDSDANTNGVTVLPPGPVAGTAAGAAGSGAAGAAGTPVTSAGGTGAAGTGGTAGSMPPLAGSGGQNGSMGGAPAQNAGSGGAGGASGAGGSGVAGAGGAGSGSAGESVAGVPEAELAMLRQVCVDEINMYRATLSLPPIASASPEQHLCSDRGAMKDADSGRAHSSAGSGNPCVMAGAGRNPFPHFGSQNTCPGYPVGGFGGATIADALKRCLQQMWAEDEPPEGEAECMRKYREGDTACFLAHGHYLNMKNARVGVACGFYNMGDSRYWMNQDFTSQ